MAIFVYKSLLVKTVTFNFKLPDLNAKSWHLPFITEIFFCGNFGPSYSTTYAPPIGSSLSMQIHSSFVDMWIWLCCLVGQFEVICNMNNLFFCYYGYKPLNVVWLLQWGYRKILLCTAEKRWVQSKLLNYSTMSWWK